MPVAIVLGIDCRIRAPTDLKRNPMALESSEPSTVAIQTLYFHMPGIGSGVGADTDVVERDCRVTLHSLPASGADARRVWEIWEGRSPGTGRMTDHKSVSRCGVEKIVTRIRASFALRPFSLDHDHAPRALCVCARASSSVCVV